MLSWMKMLVGGPVQNDYALKKSKLSRQELTKLFADELGRPMLSKHSQSVRRKAKRAYMGRIILGQTLRQIGLEPERRRG